MNASLKGTDCLQNSFDGILILSDEVAFMSGAALITAVTETASSTAPKAPPTGRQSIAFSIISPSMFLLLLNFLFSAAAHLQSV